MKFFPNSKKKQIITLVVIAVAVLLVIGFLNFGGPRAPGFSFEKPPEDSEARKAWFSKNIDNNNTEKFVYVDYEVPSWKEIEKIKKSISMTRTYPAFMNASQEYGSMTNTVDILYFSDELIDLGVNTYFIAPAYSWEYSRTEGEFELWYSGYNSREMLSPDESKRALVHTILMAKEKGMAVILFPDYFELEEGGMGRLGISDDLEYHLEKIALDLAEIAEEYQVEYFAPVNQIEMILVSNEYGVAETQKRTNDFYARLTPKIRQIYSGKIMFKMGGFNDWDNYNGISLEGADIFGFTGCYANDSDFIANDIKKSSQMADKLSAKYGIPWMNVEFLVRNQADQLRDFGEVRSNSPIEESYEAGIEAFKTYGKNAVGFTIHSLLGSGKVYGTPAMPLIKEFFASRL